MIVVRFFTGVTVKYADATHFRTLPDGRVEIYIDRNPRESEGIYDIKALAIIQPTAGAIIERGEDVAEMSHPQFPVHKKNNKNIFEKIINCLGHGV